MLEPRQMLANGLGPAVDFDLAIDWSGLLGLGGQNDQALDVVIQEDGKLLVTGEISKSDWIGDRDMLVARYNADGSIDASFNDSGFNLVDFGTNSRDIGYSIALQNDGKIVVAGTGVDYDGSGYHLIAARFNADGTLDSTYSESLSTTYGEIGDVLALSNEKILILSTVQVVNGQNDFLLTRLNADFTIDTSFGSGGSVLHDFQNQGNNAYGEMAEQSDGRIVVGGWTQGVAYYARFHADGSLDSTYVNSGETTFDTSIEGKNAFTNLVLDQNDNAFFAGRSDVTADGSNSELIVVKMDGSGNPDINFGDAGVFRHDFTAGREFNAALAVDKTGDLVVSASTDGLGEQYEFMNSDWSGWHFG